MGVDLVGVDFVGVDLVAPNPYFDPKTARGSVDCGMCLRAWLR